MNIEGELEDMSAVEEVNVNYAKATAQINYDPDKISEEEIKNVVEKLGYKVLSE